MIPSPDASSDGGGGGGGRKYGVDLLSPKDVKS